jgi:GNAT superfamily N-acetyltransferase
VTGTPSDVRIRAATEEDAGELARLRWQLYTEEAPAPAESPQEYRHRFERFAGDALTDPDWRAWVAEGPSGGLVGAMWRFRVPRIPQPDRGAPAPLGYLTNVYVEPAHRDGGLGSRMLGEVIDASRADGFSLIVTWPSERSYPFYERAGFARHEDPLMLVLDPQVLASPGDIFDR